MSLQLLRAEWLKCWRRPVNRILFALLPALLLIQFTLDAMGDRATATRVLAFPYSLSIVGGGMSKLGALLAVTFVAGCIGEEYRRDTWKMLLPRRRGRAGFLVAKGLVCAATFLAWVAGTALIGAAIAATYSRLVGVPGRAPDRELEVVAIARLAATALEMLLYGATAFTVAILLRSSYGAIFFGLVPLKVLDLASPKLGAAAQFLPVAHLHNVESRLTGWPAPLAWGTAGSLVALAAYAALCMIVAAWSFRSQEFAGSA